MSNQFKKAVIDDVSCRSIDETLQASLLDLFEYAMKTVAVTLAREAKFDTSDFAFFDSFSRSNKRSTRNAWAFQVQLITCCRKCLQSLCEFVQSIRLK